jgi:fibronectin-binding autotransporter adhesin
MKLPFRQRYFQLLTAVVALVPLSSLAALYWDADGSAVGNNTSTGANLGGTGNWDGSGKWFDGSFDVTWPGAADAVLTGAAGTVTLSLPQTATSLTFKSSGYNVTGSTLTLGPSPANITTDTGVTATITSTIAGSATMTKLGTGTLILANNNNTNTADTTGGGWRIEGGGTLVISADTALGAPLPDTARNTVTDIQFNQSTIRFDANMDLSQNRRTKVNTNSSTQNLGDAVIDVNEHTVRWFGSIQGGLGSLRVTEADDNGGMLVLGTDKIASINPWGSALPAGTVNLTVENHCVVQTSGTVTLNGGELGSETGAGGARLAILLQGGGQIRAESGDYTFQRNFIMGPGGGSLDSGAWIHHIDGGTVSGPGSLSKYGTGLLRLDNSSATWTGGTFIHNGTIQLGVGGSNGLLPGTLAVPSSIVIDAGATLKFLRGSNKSFFDNISGAGGVTIANANNAKVRLVSTNTYTGLTRIDSGVLMIGQGNMGEPGSIVSDVLNNANLDFNRVEDIGYGGTISGTGSVTKEAAGILTLTGASTYSGGTTVLAGKVAMSGASATLGTGIVTVSSASGSAVKINGGVANAIADAATLKLAGCNAAVGCTGGVLGTADGGYIDLAAGINEHVAALMFSSNNGSTFIPQVNGTYGSSASGANFKVNEYFAGSGILTVGLPGDYNNDGKVDGTDYVLWRKNPSAYGGDPAGYNGWRANYGAVSGSGAGSGLGGLPGSVPEPSSLTLLACLVALSLYRTCGRPVRGWVTLA